MKKLCLVLVVFLVASVLLFGQRSDPGSGSGVMPSSLKFVQIMEYEGVLLGLDASGYLYKIDYHANLSEQRAYAVEFIPLQYVARPISGR